MDEDEESKGDMSPQEDALDAFMSTLHADQQRQEVRGAQIHEL